MRQPPRVRVLNDGWQLGEQDRVGKIMSWKEDEAQDKTFGILGNPRGLLERA